MYRVIKLGNKFYAREIECVDDDLENINEFVHSGETVILCDEIEDLEDYNISRDEVELIK